MNTRSLPNPFRPLLVAGMLVGTFACSGASPEGDAVGEATFPDEDVALVDAEELGVIEQGISATESCDTVIPNKTITGVPGSWTAAATYNIQGCVNGYRIDANDLDLIPDEGKVLQVAPYATYGDSMPTTKAACEKTRVLVYVWERKSNGTTRYLGNDSEWGEWHGNSNWCSLPIVFPEFIIGSIPNGEKDYRLAVAARRHDKALDANSKYSRAKISFLTLDYCANLSCAD